MFINKMTYKHWVPSCPQLTSLELISEGLRSVMDEKGRELKRARTVRTEYASDVEEIQRWLRDAELKVQDRSVQPQKLKDYIQVVKYISLNQWVLFIKKSLLFF